MLHFSEGPPPSSAAGKQRLARGQEQGSLAARCNDCKLFGGREDPTLCTSAEKQREVWQKLFRQRCPRVLLRPDNVDAYDLAMLKLDENLRDLGPAWVQYVLDEDPHERRSILRRVVYALSSDRVTGALREARKRAVARHQRENAAQGARR